MPRPLKAILDDPEFAGQDPVVISACCSPITLTPGGCTAAADYWCERAGAAFHERYEACGSKTNEDDEEDDDDEDATGEEYGRRKKGKDKAASGGALKISELLKGVNLYELLECSEGSSQDEIKKAYRSLALSAHPDKQTKMDPDAAKQVQENFVRIQEAYELLSDPAKRMQYDSTLDFDDSLPKFKPGQDFFEVFSEAFRRNARFSVKRPVPELGSLQDEPKVWKRFYDFWYDFQSWRDPVMLAQADGEEILDLADAECREERRWMMRENERIARKYKQDERDRISKLVNLAESFDPRIQAEKEAKRAARAAEAAKREEERTAAKRAKDEAERQKREAEETARAAEEKKKKEEKAARDEIKERVKKLRQRLRGFHQAMKEHVVLEQLNEVCVQLKEEDLKALGDSVEAALRKDAMAAVALVHKAIESIGLAPLQVDDVSTSSGPTSQPEETAEEKEERMKKERQRQKKAAEREAKRKEEEATMAEEKAKREAEKAEERKKREELRKKEQVAAEAAKRAQEKKEEQKAKKDDEKKKKQEEQENQRREQQREEAKLKAQQQAEKDRLEAQSKKEEQDIERLVHLFSTDRIERFNKIELQTDDALGKALQEAVEGDASLAAALSFLKEQNDAEELRLDKAVALVSELSPVWPLGLPPPSHIRLPNDLRNRAKKAKNRIRDILQKFLVSAAAADTSTASEWQRGIVTGIEAIPAWSPTKQVEQPSPESPSGAAAAAGKKAKKAKAPKEEEDLDDLLAEFGATPSAKKGKKKK